MLLDGVFWISIYTIPSKYINMDECFECILVSFFSCSQSASTPEHARHTKHVPKLHFCSLLLYHLLFCETLSYNRYTSNEQPTNFAQIFRILCFFIKIGAAKKRWQMYWIGQNRSLTCKVWMVDDDDATFVFCCLLQMNMITLQSMLRCIFFQLDMHSWEWNRSRWSQLGQSQYWNRRLVDGRQVQSTACGGNDKIKHRKQMKCLPA